MIKSKDLSFFVKKMQIAYELSAMTHRSVFAEAIRNGCSDNLNSVIRMIKDQANDNRAMVAEMVGEELLRRIEALPISEIIN